MDLLINVPISPIDFSVFFKSKSNLQLFFVIDGTPPPGLTLHSITGLMNGTPIATGFFDDIRILATDERQKRVLSNTFSMSVFTFDTHIVTITADNNVFQTQEVFNIRFKSYS